MQLSCTKLLRKIFSNSAIKLNNIMPNSSCPTAQLDYQQTIEALNGLQSNASVIQKSQCAVDKRQHGENSLRDSYKYLEKAELTENDLDQLSIIHVTGTKGKGSTCALTESILRHHGFTTGFFSSPHLVCVRERIRINGVPLDCKQFTQHFWSLYDKLYAKREHTHDMPPYFKFLTLLAFQVFLEKKVDVAIIEVGVGGQYDCTNVIRRPVVCGVSSLDIDHVNVLGNTIQEIAWNKGGIFKEGAPAFTVPQPLHGMKILMQRAAERKTNLHLCPDLSTYDWNQQPVKLGLAGRAQYLNATLALQISNAWLEVTGKFPPNKTKLLMNDCNNESQGNLNIPPLATPFKISPSFYSGLTQCMWAGRAQTIQTGSVTYFLDGAHTADSMTNCIDWFKETSIANNIKTKKSIFRVLIFNSTGARDLGALLIPLSTLGFDLVIFCTNFVSINTSASSDQANFKSPEAIQLNKCSANQLFWSFLKSSSLEEVAEHETSNCFANTDLNYNIKIAKKESKDFVQLAPSYIFPCIKSALQWVLCGRNPEFFQVGDESSEEKPNELINSEELHILVTGSLHLVGGVLAILDPELEAQIPKAVPEVATIY